MFYFIDYPHESDNYKIVDGFVPNFMGRFLGARGDQVRVSLRSVKGCGSNCQKTP